MLSLSLFVSPLKFMYSINKKIKNDMSEKTVMLGELQYKEKEKRDDVANSKVISSLLKTPKACRPKQTYLSEKKINSFSLIDAGQRANEFKPVKRMNSLSTKTTISSLLTKKLTIQTANAPRLEKLSTISFINADANIKTNVDLPNENRTRNKTGPNSSNHKSCDLNSQSTQKKQVFKSMSKQTTKYK